MRRVLFGVPRRSTRAGFSLVEVALALGIFSFAIVPVIGLMGMGLSVSKESIEGATMSQIFRMAEAQVVTRGALTSGTAPMYFSNYGVETTGANDANTVYQVNFSDASPTDAAQGLLARRVLKVAVARVATSNTMITTFLQLSKDPVDLKSYFP